MGKATVSATIGAEGLDVHHGRDIVLADDPASFAESFVAFLRNDDLRRRHEAEAAATPSQHDWSVIAERFLTVLQIAIEAVRRPASLAAATQAVSV